MIFEKLVVGSYMSNCYIIGCDRTKEAVIIDPGANFNLIKETVKELGVIPKLVILTHGHGDHIQALKETKDEFNVKILIHETESNMLEDPNKNFSKMMFRKPISITADRNLKDGEVIVLGDLKLEIIHTPGHTPGSISIKVENILITGDTLFNGSIGRTDFPGGSFDELINSIKNKLYKFEDNTIVYPGHNSPTTIGTEKNSNPFVN